eukprot:c18063_g1_i1 orf=268-450(+)
MHTLIIHAHIDYPPSHMLQFTPYAFYTHTKLLSPSTHLCASYFYAMHTLPSIINTIIYLF